MEGNILESVVITVAEVIGQPPEKIGLDDDLNSDLDVDSLDLVQIVMLLEDKHYVTLRNLGWACSGHVSVRQIVADILQLTGTLTKSATP